MNQFCTPENAKTVLDAVCHYHNLGRWHAHVFLLMPDHIHGLISFPMDPGLKKTVSAWKRYLAHAAGIRWQRDFFDHRLRNDENHVAKAHYIRMNPVRAGLVKHMDDWPYVWPKGEGAGPGGAG